MEKISFDTLGLSLNQETKIVNFNGQDIEVRQYLPVNDKLELINKVINGSADENNFANPIKVKVYTIVEILKAYTNIEFPEMEIQELYDIVTSTGLAALVTEHNIPEYYQLIAAIQDSQIAYYNYRNSVYGIMESIGTNYSNLNIDAENLQKKIADPQNLELLKEVLTKLG